MKIRVTRELKIAMLEALGSGYLDLWKVPELLKEVQGMSAFGEMLMQSYDEDTIQPQKQYNNDTKPQTNAKRKG